MLTICIPSYQREAWLSEVFIKNLSKTLLEPFSGRIEALLMVQAPEEGTVPKIAAIASETPHLKVILTEHRLNCSIAQIRFECMLKGIYHYPETKYVYSMDDDCLFFGNRYQICADFERLIQTLEDAPEERTYCIFPGREFKVEPYTHPMSLKQELLPTYLRGHVYAKKAVLELDHLPLREITVGEDYVFPAILKRPIMKVTGFERILHLCERTLFKTDILSESYETPVKKEALAYRRRYLIPYKFKSTGYDLARATVGYKDFCTIYPEFFTPEGYYLNQVPPIQTAPAIQPLNSTHSFGSPSKLSGYNFLN